MSGLLLKGCNETGDEMGLFDGLLGHGSEAEIGKIIAKLDGILLPGEQAQLAFKIIRDFFVFTDRRFILVDIQGITGRKVDYLSIPYRSITRFSLETAGTFDLDAELKLWVSGEPKPIERTLSKHTDIKGIQRALAAGVLGR